MGYYRSKCAISLAAVISLVALTGCGGGNGGSSATAKSQAYSVNGRTYSVRADTTITTASVSLPQWRTQVNQVCREAWPTIQENFDKYLSWQNQHLPMRVRMEKTIRLSVLAGIDFHIFDNIHKEKAPEGEQASVEELIGAMQAAVEHGEKLHMHSQKQLFALFADFNRRARRYGLDDCIVNGAHLKL